MNAQIPVCAHIGLTPQSSNMFGGFRVQGKSEEAAKELIEAAQAVEKAGAFMLVLEGIPEKLSSDHHKESDIFQRYGIRSKCVNVMDRY